MNRVEPNRNVYVGHRYVPLLVGEWDKSIQYEGLSIVTFKGSSYTSKKMTPAGIDIENKEYWVLTGNYNAQIEYYREETERVSDDLAQAKIDLNQRIDENVQYVDSNVEDLTIYIDDEVGKNKEYIDGEISETIRIVNDKNTETRQYVDGEISTLNNFVVTEISENREFVETENKKTVDYVDGELSDNIRILNEDISKKSDIGELGFSVNHFGAIGDGETDNTQSFQSAIDYADEHGINLFIPAGKYLIKDTLYLPKSLRIAGVNNNHHLYPSDRDVKTRIMTESQYVFEPKYKELNVNIMMENIQFEGLNSFNNGTSNGNEDSTFFNDVRFMGSEITGCTFFHYGTWLYGSLEYVSFVHHNHFLGIRRYLVNGYLEALSQEGGSIIDSEFSNNYINGRPLTNATCFKIANFAVSKITNNFIDYFKIVFDYQRQTQGSIISLNSFDYCKTVFKGTMIGLVINGNVFHVLDKETVLPSFLYPDDELINDDWWVFDPDSITDVVISNNYIRSADNFLQVVKYPNFDIKSIGNVHRNVSTKATFSAVRSSDERDHRDIYIEELEKNNYSELPRILWQGVRSFYEGQTIKYNNKILIATENEWIDYMGNIVTE